MRMRMGMGIEWKGKRVSERGKGKDGGICI